ncbi:hypothetical protein QMO56_22710 [Roseomonas sp. E05]|uniref:hypothetical protein n=1 Tax=Roseomonas sp. E05 TaxID=3046310 RepID=UPI0024B909EB|nr:hypothetical protein [Roseomonas sp. E05]MDJ0390933.1 hypothetical protein [Roseomonas sp. E05]
MTTWTRVTDPDMAATLLPAWFAARMMGTRGSYGFLLTTGDVVRVSRVTAIHVSSDGPILIDVLLDHAGVPGGVDTAWQPKHFLGAPVPGANLATLNLSQVAIAVEFTVAEIAETALDAKGTAAAADQVEVPDTIEATAVGYIAPVASDGGQPISGRLLAGGETVDVIANLGLRAPQRG